MRMIRAGQVQPGDLIYSEECGMKGTVRSVGKPEMLGGKLYIEFPNQSAIFLRDHEEVVLLNRPWPHGKTEVDMYNAVVFVMARVAAQGRTGDAIRVMRDAADDYLMGPEGGE